MCHKFLLALELQDEIAPGTGARQIIRIYGISPGNRHHDNGVQWRKIGVYMFKGTPYHVLTYFKCRAGKDANEGEAGFATLKGTQSLAMNAEVSGSGAGGGRRAAGGGRRSSCRRWAGEQLEAGSSIFGN